MLTSNTPKTNKQNEKQNLPFTLKKNEQKSYLLKLILKEYILLFLKRIGKNKCHLILLDTLLNALQESTQTMTAEDNIVRVYKIYICANILHIYILTWPKLKHNRVLNFLGNDQEQRGFCSTKTITEVKKGQGKSLDLQCIFPGPKTGSSGTSTTVCSI